MSTSVTDPLVETDSSASTSSSTEHRSSTQYSFTPSPENSKTSTKPELSDDESEEKKDDSMFVCNICLDIAKDAVVSMCGHLYCWPCLSEFLNLKWLKLLLKFNFRHLAWNPPNPSTLSSLQSRNFEGKSHPTLREKQRKATRSTIESPATSTRSKNRARPSARISRLSVFWRRWRFSFIVWHRCFPLRFLRFQFQLQWHATSGKKHATARNCAIRRRSVFVESLLVGCAFVLLVVDFGLARNRCTFISRLVVASMKF